ncbi:hypothetical protein H6G00_01385 [Leptolyngbya sp. FACHB-541]|uniref:hypothetical protein n=1 Tax=Leptolyngbya sp. FACHB-541 TaxID=2692810 RepID=UPI001685BBBD|nr:hypothetical protein [Leptolyngbya sp. FACHB-541]MBD1995282.1 hypothetical protein [Leptolyngbya sp. FACHB-541]
MNQKKSRAYLDPDVKAILTTLQWVMGERSLGAVVSKLVRRYALRFLMFWLECESPPQLKTLIWAKIHKRPKAAEIFAEFCELMPELDAPELPTNKPVAKAEVPAPPPLPATVTTISLPVEKEKKVEPTSPSDNPGETLSLAARMRQRQRQTATNQS